MKWGGKKGHEERVLTFSLDSSVSLHVLKQAYVASVTFKNLIILFKEERIWVLILGSTPHELSDLTFLL